MTTKNEKTMFESALIATQKRTNKVNVDLFNSHKSKSAHDAKIVLNSLFKVSHYGLNSVLKSALELWDTNAFKELRKKLQNQKQITLLKSDFQISSLKKLFNTIDFVVSYDTTTKKYETRNNIYRLKKIDKGDLASCSVVSGKGTMFGKEFNFDVEHAYFEKKVETKDGIRYDYYTLIPKANFTLWELLGLLEKFKSLELEKKQVEEKTKETK